MNYEYTPKAYKMVRYLQQEPKARERANKNRAIVNLLQKEYGWLLRLLQDQPDAKQSVANFVHDVLYYDRKWRLILKQEEELRGSDYGDKDELEEKTLVELGKR